MDSPRSLERTVATENGWEEDDLDDQPFTQLIVQFPIRGHGTVEDLHFRHQLEDSLDQALRSTVLGHVDGGDIGSGTINIFAIVEPNAWEQAWAVIRTELVRQKLLRRAVVARDARGYDGDEWPVIIWPEDYEREFSYW
jgi:hypothetical protein